MNTLGAVLTTRLPRLADLPLVSKDALSYMMLTNLLNVEVDDIVAARLRQALDKIPNDRVDRTSDALAKLARTAVGALGEVFLAVGPDVALVLIAELQRGGEEPSPAPVSASAVEAIDDL